LEVKKMKKARNYRRHFELARALIILSGLMLLTFGQTAAAAGAQTQPSTIEKVAAIVTNPSVSPIILMIGIACVVIEALTAGFGIIGILGGSCLVLYFAGHYYMGMTGLGAILLFIAGALLMVIEACIPGFGVPGICGILSFMTSIILMAPSVQAGVQSILIALAGSVALIAVGLRFLGRSKYWDRLALTQSLGKEEGYISQKEDYSAYIGRKGKTLTPLRPAGIMALDDGKRLDVVSEGGFVEKGAAVIITATDGPKILASRDAE
jgi:membrane-bound serine protease (ClpP class)